MYQGEMVINAEDVFGQFSNLSESQGSRDTFEKSWNWPGEIGNGFMSIISLRPGIFLEIGDFRLFDARTCIAYELTPLVCFGFSISGSTKYKFGNGNGKNDFWGYKQGVSVVGFKPKQWVKASPSAGSQRYVYIWIDPVLLKTFINEQLGDLPVAFQNIMNGFHDQYYRELTSTPYINMAISQIMNCPYHSSLKRLYIESKSMELISYSIAQLVPLAKNRSDTFALRADDKERILQARDILISNLNSPPSLLELARQVGTNKTTLNKGFRQLFGTTTFEYLRIYRLERAKALLETRQMNVTQAALDVGYSRPSCFTRAYKDHFGRNPKDYFGRQVVI